MRRADRQTDRQSSAGINTPSCADRGCRSPCYNYQMRNRPLGFCGVIRLGSQGSQTNTRSIQAGSALWQHGQRHSKIIIAVVTGYVAATYKDKALSGFLGAVALVVSAGHTSAGSSGRLCRRPSPFNCSQYGQPFSLLRLNLWGQQEPL